MRIYYVHPVLVGPLSMTPHARWAQLCARAQALGFDTLMIAPLWMPDASGNLYVARDVDRLNPALDTGHTLTTAFTSLAALCAEHNLAFMLDLVLDRVAPDNPLVQAHPHWWVVQNEDQIHHQAPPHAPHEHLTARLRQDHGEAPRGFIEQWVERLVLWANAGISGFRCTEPQCLAAADWHDLITGVNAHRPHCRFLAWTPGLDPWQLQALTMAGFHGVFSSLPWWDYHAPWLVEETMRLRAVAPIIAPVEAPTLKRLAAWRPDPEGQYLNAKRAIWTATIAGDGGIFVPMGFEDSSTLSLAFPCEAAPMLGPEETLSPLQHALHEEILQANQWLAHTPQQGGRLHSLLGPLASGTALFRGDGHPCATSTAPGAAGRLVVLNPNDHAAVSIDWKVLQARLPDNYILIEPDPTVLASEDTLPESLSAGTILHFNIRRLTAIQMSPFDGEHHSLTTAMRAPRIVIRSVSPSVDEGKFAVKTIVGEPIDVQAEVFIDGHLFPLTVNLLWRAADESDWQTVSMTELGNDRWQGFFAPQRNGRHVFIIQAWVDTWRAFCDGLSQKHHAGQDVAIEVADGRRLLAQALQRLPAQASSALALQDALDALEASSQLPHSLADQITVLLADTTASAMQQASERPFITHSETAVEVIVDRVAARFASWYELFPRSQSNDPNRHGTLADVIAQLPRIRNMGFDTLYFPPIHPIGHSHRKGRNNSLHAGPNDPGSPYAIGSEEGGHDTIHPQLGTLKDFKHLIQAAQQHDLEIALDFAIQCSPDHPWLKMHPEWFDWRSDGSVQYAENPPKKYEDIVNVDFYGATPNSTQQAPLWLTLRNIVLFWIAQGIHVFRVDNPHTKPLPFWQWLIADVQSRHPETIFLAEAFTRPTMMYHLAKLGFTQSYTYFTWREHKQEFIDYLNELNQTAIATFFRPHFFVNTPDINPYYLQTSSRAGFLIRAALAATLSGLWGVYNGFELCEGRAQPGKEEYLDSEKYEIRVWDPERPGNIVREITQLNRIRRSNLALHTHLGCRFHACQDDRVLFFSKATAQRDNVLFVAISVDAFEARTAAVELPFEDLGLSGHSTLFVEDLIDGSQHTWSGKHQTFYLTPAQPYRIWRLMHLA